MRDAVERLLSRDKGDTSADTAVGPDDGMDVDVGDPSAAKASEGKSDDAMDTSN